MSRKSLVKFVALPTLTAGLLFTFFPTPASADSGAGLAFGNLQMARTVGQGVTGFGGAVNLGDEATTVYGHAVYGFGLFTEGRIRLGLIDADVPNSDPQITIGAEFKYQFWNYEGESVDDPVDLAFSGMIEAVDYGYGSAFSLGSNVIASRPFTSSNGTQFGPYARFNLRITSFSPKGGGSDSDFEFALTPGAMFQAGEGLRLFGEFTIDENSGVALGVEFLMK